jgi:glycosyltransferase involved in cell wall biosynthesis
MKEAQKILIFSVAYYPKFVGGAEVAVKEITDRLSPDAWEFHLLTLRLDKTLPKYEKIGNVHVYRLGFAGRMKESADSLRFPLHYNKYLYPFLSAWYALKLSKKHQFKMTWAIMANYSGFGALFFKWLKPKIPMLLTLQEGDPIEYIKNEALSVRVGSLKIPVSFFMLPILKQIFKKADAIQAISTYLANFGKSMGFEGEPVVVPNGVDVSLFTKDLDRETREQTRQSLGLSKDDVGVVTTSRLVIKNGVGDVISALALLPEKYKFVVFGEGYLEKDLRLKIKDLKLEERVLLKGFLPHKDMPRMLKACDIFIRPSLSEGFGNSFIEAMAARLPVVATREGGIADFLFDPNSPGYDSQVGQTGYVCEKENPESIKDAILRAASDPRRDEVIENAFKMAIGKYNWEVVVSDIKNVFEDTINLIK